MSRYIRQFVLLDLLLPWIRLLTGLVDLAPKFSLCFGFGDSCLFCGIAPKKVREHSSFIL